MEKERNKLRWHTRGAAGASASDRDGWRDLLPMDPMRMSERVERLTEIIEMNVRKLSVPFDFEPEFPVNFGRMERALNFTAKYHNTFVHHCSSSPKIVY